MAAPPAEKPEPDEKIAYKNVDNAELMLHVFRPSDEDGVKGKRKAIVFFFGGGWNGGTPAQFYAQSRHLTEHGLVAICADYRTASRHKTTPKQCVQDGKSALRWIRSHANELGIDPEWIAAGGGSAGGHVAATTATASNINEPGEDTTVSCRPRALVLFNPVFDNGPDGYGYERVKDYWKDFSPLHNLSADMPPTLVMFGTQDKLVPVKTAQRFQQEMQELGIRCELRLYENDAHGFFNTKRYDETVRDMDQFLQSLGFFE
ncbi:alpha/beta hydrolase [Novipirellula artificiosorum]|uniref:alpha/beta hydrolase n=1 Tax=Novipirellula artificiosorum TaxID=2528016 RepID=UPI001E33AB47|nr:alpha/beta hydrolase [Novipirellula artificiosorum]